MLVLKGKAAEPLCYGRIVEPPRIPRRGARQQLEGNERAVLLRPENPLPFIAAGAEMINCALKLEAQHPRHLSLLPVVLTNVKIYVTPVLPTPAYEVWLARGNLLF